MQSDVLGDSMNWESEERELGIEVPYWLKLLRDLRKEIEGRAVDPTSSSGEGG